MATSHVPDPFDLTLEQLQRRRSAKWTHAPHAGVPMWVAEMDVRLAEPVAQALHDAIDAGDTGYPGDHAAFARAYADFAESRWGWRPDVARTETFSDLGASGTALLRLLAGPSNTVVLTTPVYNAFYLWCAAAEVRPVEVPLRAATETARLDLPGIEAALEAGTRVVLLSNPHNPTGAVPTRDELAALAEIADRHGAVVIADEIHAPLTHPGARFTPYLSVSEAARRTGICTTSASKAFNLAGLKASLLITEAAGPDLTGLPAPHDRNVGHLGVLAAEAAFREGGAWLDAVTHQVARNAAHARERLAAELPELGVSDPRASYLLWLDWRAYDLGDDPTGVIAERAGVVLSAGPAFGAGGGGHARMNIGTTPAILDDAIDRLVAAFGR
ncbi:hypothetical protein BJF82_09210 [Kytococcus sp. CUA-901]|nr:hypothetical protein BJF82_09210 [Kytococcus sp. CUA-901]